MPVSGAGYLQYGGNTTCVEARLDSGVSILFDAGTGIAVYDRETPQAQKCRVICFTHTHLDHIQGLPFFSGFFDRNAPLVLIGPAFEKNATFRNSLEHFFDGAHTPYVWENLPHHEVGEVKQRDNFELYGARFETCPTIHPGGNLAWKITADGWTFAFTGDHEIPLDKSDTKRNIWSERLMGFLAGSDVVLADGHFTAEHHKENYGKGHSDPGQWQTELADRGIGKIYFTHFHPAYNDRKMAELLAEAEQGPIPAGLAYDGAVITSSGMRKKQEPEPCSSCAFSRKVAHFSDTHSIVDALLTSARKLANAEGGTVYLVAGGMLNFAAAQNDVLFRDSAANKFTFFNARIPVTTASIAGYVAKTGQILNIPNVYDLPEDCEYTFNSGLDVTTGYKTTSVLAVPLTNGQGVVVGVLQLINARGFAGAIPFSDQIAEEVVNLAQMATIPLERSFLVISMILRILKTAALRDPAETSGHAQRVGNMAAELYHYWADKHNHDPEELLFTKGQLRLAAMLHDVGKVGVPDAVLKKPGKLTDQERLIMQRHSSLGAGLFDGSEHIIDHMAKDIALHHHARWDGSGYTGRKDTPSPGGEEIPLWARITAIADVYDALVSPRPYRKVWTSREAVAYLRQEAGKHFDPELVEDFRSIMDIVKSIYERFPDELHK